MDYTDSNDIDGEWQRIEQQSSPETSPTTINQSTLAWDMVVVNENYLPVDQYSSVGDSLNPTHRREGSSETVPTTTEETEEEDGASSPLEEGAVARAPPSDWRVRVANEGRKLLKLRLEAARNGVVRVAVKAREFAVCAGAFWSFACVAGAAAAVLVAVAYVGIRRRRRRRRADQGQSVEDLVYLLREKDEKISQLLLQIAQLNEVLSSRRKVPVLRISS